MISSAVLLVAADNSWRDIQFIPATCCTRHDAARVRLLTTRLRVIFGG